MTIHQDPELVMTLQSVIEFIGTFAFALSGIRLAASKHYDWLGGFVCGVAVAIGGGTIRDVMLGLTPFWMSSPVYLLFTFLAHSTHGGSGRPHRPCPVTAHTTTTHSGHSSIPLSCFWFALFKPDASIICPFTQNVNRF